MKISFKLTVILIALSLFSIVSVGIVLLTRSRAIVFDLSEKYASAKAMESAAVVSGLFETNCSAVVAASNIMEQYQALAASNRRNLFNVILQGILEENPELIAVWCLWEPNVLEGNDREFIGTPGTAPDGRFAPYWCRLNGKVKLDFLVDYDTYGPGDYYLLARDSKRTTVLDPYEYSVGGKVMLVTSVAVPFFGSDGKVLGVIGIDIDVNDIQEISRLQKPYPDAVTAVFSHDGTIAAHFDTGRIGKNINAERDLAGRYLEDLIKAVKAGKTFTFTNYVQEFKEDMKIFAYPITIGESNTPWSFMVATSLKTVMAPVNYMMYITIMVSVIVLVLASVAAIVLSRNISRPIVKVAETLKDISEGEGDLTRIITADTKDEIGDLARYFNQTLAKIKNLVVSIKKEAVNLSEVGADLSVNMSNTASAVNQITANIRNIKGQAINQSASLTETNATMKQVVANINKLNSHIENQSKDVTQASSAIEEIVTNINSVTSTLVHNADNVKALKDASEIGRIGLQQVASYIQEIARDSEGILEINSVMENIASQTNLLSMNAAIEAAHAGEAGKGFAVVADEIRKLAESSSKQSKTIGTVLKKIKESIDKISKSTDSVLTKFGAIDSSVRIVAEQEDNIRRAMQEQSVGSKQLLQGAGNLNNITQQVKTGSEEMLGGSKEVINESQNLEKITIQITGGMNEMASGAEQINVAVNHVNDISGKTREGIETLLREVSQFKVE